MSVRGQIERHFAAALTEAGTTVPAAFNDDMILLQSGLDSLGFAVLVTRLEQELNYDPFSLMEEAVYPRTFGDLVAIYEHDSKIMPSVDLQSLLLERIENPDLWVTGQQDWSVPDVLGSMRTAKPFCRHAHRKRVALACSSNLSVVWALCLLDGVAESVLLVPSGLSQSTLSSFCEQVAFDFLVCEQEKPVPVGLESLELLILPPPVRNGDYSARGTALTTAKTHWLLATSGTTETPRLVPHTLQSLIRTAKRDLTKGAKLRWGLLYEVTRFAGLQVFLQSLVGGSSLAIPPTGWPLPQTLEFLQVKNCNALSATPTLWRKILMIPNSDKLNLKLITLGGEVADDGVLRALQKSYPSATIRHIYASTEAGVGFSVTDGKTGFPTSFLKNAPMGVRLRVRAEDQMLLIQPDSENPRSYADRDTRIVDEEGWIETGDIVHTIADRVLFLGRANGAINVGGAKVHPTEVEAVLRQLPWVEEVLVRGKKNPFTGSLVEAWLTIRREASGDRPSPVLVGEAKEHCRARLEPFKVPALLHITEELPVNSTGKLNRSAIETAS